MQKENRKLFYSILSAIKINMLKEQRVDTLHPGNAFREWLIDVLNDRIRNKRCDVAVYKLGPASHTVCRYEFQGEVLQCRLQVLWQAFRKAKGSRSRTRNGPRIQEAQEIGEDHQYSQSHSRKTGFSLCPGNRARARQASF